MLVGPHQHAAAIPDLAHLAPVADVVLVIRARADGDMVRIGRPSALPTAFAAALTQPSPPIPVSSVNCPLPQRSSVECLRPVRS
jgi:hypothetical protein